MRCRRGTVGEITVVEITEVEVMVDGYGRRLQQIRYRRGTAGEITVGITVETIIISENIGAVNRCLAPST